MRFNSLLAVALAAVPAAHAQFPIGWNGTCSTNPYNPGNETLVCIWGQLVAIRDCMGGTSCSEDGADCGGAQLSPGSAWYVHCW
jgi:hypothetical protein